LQIIRPTNIDEQVMKQRTLVTWYSVTAWTARVLGLAFFVFMILFVVAHAFSPDGLPPVWRMSPDVQLDSLALFMMVVGGVMGWRSVGAASIFTLAGYMFWQAVERHLPWPPGVVEIPLLIGLLYAFAWSCEKRLTALKRLVL
jgi:hypothetical protein